MDPKKHDFIGKVKTFLPHGVETKHATFKMVATATPRVLLESRRLYLDLQKEMAEAHVSPFADVVAVCDLLATAIARAEQTILSPVTREGIPEYCHARLEEMLPGAREIVGEISRKGAPQDILATEGRGEQPPCAQ